MKDNVVNSLAFETHDSLTIIIKYLYNNINLAKSNHFSSKFNYITYDIRENLLF